MERSLALQGRKGMGDDRPQATDHGRAGCGRRSSV